VIVKSISRNEDDRYVTPAGQQLTEKFDATHPRQMYVQYETVDLSWVVGGQELLR
jgi:hypothetical protein